MERDFMGLSKLKEETSEEPIDAVPVRSSLTMAQWPPSNKNHHPPSTVVPQFMSFQGKQQPKIGFDALASNGLVSITTSDSFDPNRKPYADSFVQQPKNVVLLPEKQGGVSYSIHHQLNGAIISPPFGQNLIGSMSSKPLAVNSISHSGSPVVGSTELRNSLKISTRPAQLTIFYNGSVCVYDHVSPEKAQAIMLLAGNGPSSTSATNPIVNPIQTTVPKASLMEGFVLNQPQVITTTTTTTTTTASRWPSPSPLTSVSTVSGNNNVDTTVKLGGLLVQHPRKEEPLKAVVNTPRSPSSAALLSPDTVPQFRKKSLARFLEKRKERLVSSAPYGTKQSAPNSSDSSSIAPTQ